MIRQQPQLNFFCLKTEFASSSVIFRLLTVALINGAELHGNVSGGRSEGEVGDPAGQEDVGVGQGG